MDERVRGAERAGVPAGDPRDQSSRSWLLGTRSAVWSPCAVLGACGLHLRSCMVERRCVCAGSASGCGRKTNKPTSRWANKQHEARSSIHGGHERVRMLLPAFAGSKHPEKSTMPEGIGACGSAPNGPGRAGTARWRGSGACRVRSRECLMLGMVAQAAIRYGARPHRGAGRWITRRSAPSPRPRSRTVGPRRCDFSDCV